MLLAVTMTILDNCQSCRILILDIENNNRIFKSRRTHVNTKKVTIYNGGVFYKIL